MVVTTYNGDIFEHSSTIPIAHCISSDLRMSAGFAKSIVSRYGRIPHFVCSPSQCGVGDVIMYTHSSRRIYHLVTKLKYWEKPVYADVLLALQTLHDVVVEYNDQTIHMPRIASGLDQLSWHIIYGYITTVFAGRNVDVIVYLL